MYKDVQFRLQPLEWIEEDLKELAEMDPHAKTIQLISSSLARFLTLMTVFLDTLQAWTISSGVII